MFGWLFGNGKKEEPVLPLSRPPSPTVPTAPLEQVVVKNRNATPLPPSVVPTIQGSAPSAVVVQPRRGEYVALGGSRKSGKGRKKSKKSKASKKSKSSKSRK